jgi:hypothetical protein
MEKRAGEGWIRPAVEADLDAICELNARVYPERTVTPERTEHMREVLFDHPWRDDRFPSLAYENAGGRITGFIGVMPRSMALGARELVAAISHRFMVDPADRGSLGALALVKTFLAGRQDLSITEPENPAARRIFERFGSHGIESQSFEWSRPVRPFGWAAQHARSAAPRVAYRLLDVIPAWFDTCAGAVSNVRPRGGREAIESLTPELMRRAIDETARTYPLRPVHREGDLKWLLDRLEGKRSRGALRGHVGTGPDAPRIGAYLYYCRPGGTGLVVSVWARPQQIAATWNHLLADAWCTGTVALRGKYDAVVARVADRALFVRRSPHTFLLHTSQSDVERAIAGGQAYVSRLEGEGGIPFGDNPAGSLDDGK